MCGYTGKESGESILVLCQRCITCFTEGADRVLRD
jgi:hypothetical protein